MIFYSFRNLIIAYVLLIAIVLLVLLYTFSNLRSQVKQLDSIQASREVLQKVGPFVEHLDEFVLGLNNYTYSVGERNENFYTTGLIKLRNDSVQLVKLYNIDSSTQNKQDYKILVNLLHEMTDLATLILHLNTVNGIDTARAELKKAETLKITSGFKTAVDDIQDNKRKALSNAYYNSITLARKTFVFTGVISGMLILTLIISFLVSYKDILNRFSYNRDLEKFRNALNNSVDAIYILDKAQMTYIDVNDACCSSTGYTRKELLTMGPQHLRRLQSEEILLHEYDAIIKSPLKKETQITKYFRKDGSSFDAEISVQAMKDGIKDVLITVARDITERKKAEDQLKKFNEELEVQVNKKTAEIRASEEKYRTIVEQASDGIFISAPDLSILDANNSGCSMLGYTKEELQKLKFTELIDPENLKNHPIMHKDLSTGNTVINERKLIRKDGSEISAEITAKLLSNGKYQTTIRDITEQKKAKDELEKSYKEIRQLSEHLQNIREEERISIAREIHDELGQQLTVLKMDIYWLKKKLDKSDEETEKRINDLLKLADSTINSVRKISSELRPGLLDDLGLVATMEWQLSEFEKHSGIKTTFNVEESEILLPDRFKSGLFRIFQESLTNVARHANAKKVIVNLRQEQGKVLLYIEDNGKGFDKNKTADKRTLGILGMKERTEMMGGEYEIKSIPGKGTTVLVAIPLQD